MERVTSEGEDVVAIAAYLGISPNGPRMVRITGLSRAKLTAVVAGSSTGVSPRRTHVANVAELVRLLQATRLAATGRERRGRPSATWLFERSIETSQGAKRPIDVLADDRLAAEALDDLRSR